jgi:protein-L-isoaspartate(D-aspartate) O-methyltransferase
MPDEFSNRIEQTFRAVPRHHFMPSASADMADYDKPFQIGYGQTISQPTTVKRMLSWLEPRPGDKVLDLGSGSGWTTALLSFLVGEEGLVYGVERISQLKDFGEQNCLHYGCDNVRFFLAQQTIGLSEFAPFDRILVSAASAANIPGGLITQLANNGKLVIPVVNSIFELQKNDQGEISDCQEHLGYIFVPLII